MSEPNLPLWNSDNSDVLPAYQLTFGHTLFRGVSGEAWPRTLFKALGLGTPHYDGPTRPNNFPHRGKLFVLGSGQEVHLVISRAADVWCVFGPHELFFSNRNWIEFNSKALGLMAVCTQTGTKSFFYDIFENGVKQTNAVAEGSTIRIIEDRRIVAFLGDDRILDHRPKGSVSEGESRDLIEHDLAIAINDSGNLTISTRFQERAFSPEPATHCVFSRKDSRKSFLGIQWQ